MTTFSNIPAGTTVGETHTVGTQVYVWDGTVWNLRVTQGSGGGGSGPFSAFTLEGTPSSTNTIPKWTNATTLTWSPDNTSSGGSGVDVVTTLPTASADTVGDIVYLNQLDTSTSPDRELGFYIGTTSGGGTPTFDWALIGNTTTVSDGGDTNIFADVDEIQFNSSDFSLARPSEGDRNHVVVSAVAPTVDQTYSATSANAQSGVAVAQAIATVAPTGIQRLVTNLPHHSHRIVNSTSEQYWLLIDTDTAVNADIEVWFRGTRIPAASLSKPGAVNLHLATGDNIFFFTLDQNQLNSWNSNSRSATPDSNGFEIRDDTSTPLETIHDYNQFFTGTGQVYQEMHFISPDRTQTGTITFDNDGNFVFSAPVRGPDFTET